MNRSIFALMIGACAVVACNAHVTPGENDDSQALEQGAGDKGTGGSDKGDPGDPGKGDPGKGEPGKGGCDGGGKDPGPGGKDPGDGGQCITTTIDGCLPPDVAKELPYQKCSGELEVVDLKYGPPCEGQGTDGLSFTCCPAPPPPPSTCFKELVSDLCSDPLALKNWSAKCDGGLTLPDGDLCADDVIVVCCVLDESKPPPTK